MTLYEKMQMEREEGRQEGREEGWLNGLLEMIRDGFISYDIAAKRAEQKYGIKEEEFRKISDAYGENNQGGTLVHENQDEYYKAIQLSNK